MVDLLPSLSEVRAEQRRRIKAGQGVEVQIESAYAAINRGGVRIQSAGPKIAPKRTPRPEPPQKKRISEWGQLVSAPVTLFTASKEQVSKYGESVHLREPILTPEDEEIMRLNELAAERYRARKNARILPDLTADGTG